MLAHLTVVLAAAGSAAAASFCDASFPGGKACLAELTTTSDVVFRVGVPDAAAAPFDTLLQIEAPEAIGWAGLAWGGHMTKNPLTVAWPSGDGAMVSSRWATGHTYPGAYAGAAYTTLTSERNATHWMLMVLCAGCSQWDTDGAMAMLDTTAAAGTALSWASSTRAVTTPASNTSTFGYHTAHGDAAVDLSAVRMPSAVFDAYVAFLQGSSSSVSAPALTSAPATVTVTAGAGEKTVISTVYVTVSASTTMAAPPLPPPPPPAAPYGNSTATSANTTHPAVGKPPAMPPKPTQSIPSTTLSRPQPSSSVSSNPAPPSASSATTRLPVPMPMPTPSPSPSTSSIRTISGKYSTPTVTVTIIAGGSVPSGFPEPPGGVQGEGKGHGSGGSSSSITISKTTWPLWPGGLPRA